MTSTVSPRLIYNLPEYQAPTEMFPEQADIYMKTRDWPQLALWADPGLGKTKMMLDQAGYLYMEGKIRALTLIVPLKAVDVWPYQMEIHWKNVIPRTLGHYNGASMPLKQKEALRKLYTNPWTASDCALRVMIFHHESLSTPKGKEAFLAWTKRWGRQSMMVLDESHHYKTPSSVRTKLLMKVGPDYGVRRVMSGTPMNEYIDLYSQYKILDRVGLPPWTGAKTATEFRSMYAVLRKMDRFDIIVGYRNIDALMERTRPVTITLKEGDCAALPEVRCLDAYVSLTPEQKKIYEQLRDTFLAELDDGLVVTEAMAMLRVRRLQEVLSGFVRYEENDEAHVQFIPSNRPQACLEEFRERNVKTIIWCGFQPEVPVLQQVFREAKIDTYLFYGGNIKDRKEQLRAFQASTKIDALIMTAATGGEALTILEPRHTIWYTHPWSHLKVHQANKRNHRIGQKFETVRTRLIAKGTVDVRIIRKQDERLDMSNVLRERGGVRVLRDLLALR